MVGLKLHRVQMTPTPLFRMVVNRAVTAALRTGKTNTFVPHQADVYQLGGTVKTNFRNRPGFGKPQQLPVMFC